MNDATFDKAAESILKIFAQSLKKDNTISDDVAQAVSSLRDLAAEAAEAAAQAVSDAQIDCTTRVVHEIRSKADIARCDAESYGIGLLRSSGDPKSADYMRALVGGKECLAIQHAMTSLSKHIQESENVEVAE